MNFMTFHILGIVIPIDFHIFQRGRDTTNQKKTMEISPEPPSNTFFNSKIHYKWPFAIAMWVITRGLKIVSILKDGSSTLSSGVWPQNILRPVFSFQSQLQMTFCNDIYWHFPKMALYFWYIYILLWQIALSCVIICLTTTPWLANCLSYYLCIFIYDMCV